MPKLDTYKKQAKLLVAGTATGTSRLAVASDSLRAIARCPTAKHLR